MKKPSWYCQGGFSFSQKFLKQLYQDNAKHSHLINCEVNWFNTKYSQWLIAGSPCSNQFLHSYFNKIVCYKSYRSIEQYIKIVDRHSFKWMEKLWLSASFDTDYFRIHVYFNPIILHQNFNLKTNIPTMYKIFIIYNQSAMC